MPASAPWAAHCLHTSDIQYERQAGKPDLSGVGLTGASSRRASIFSDAAGNEGAGPSRLTRHRRAASVIGFWRMRGTAEALPFPKGRPMAPVVAVAAEGHPARGRVF